MLKLSKEKKESLVLRHGGKEISVKPGAIVDVIGDLNVPGDEKEAVENRLLCKYSGSLIRVDKVSKVDDEPTPMSTTQSQSDASSANESSDNDTGSNGQLTSANEKTEAEKKAEKAAQKQAKKEAKAKAKKEGKSQRGQ